MIKIKRLYILLIIFIIGCESNTEIPLPTNPLEKFALPKAVFSLTIAPNPISATSLTQTWTITETNGVGFDIEQIALKIYDQNNNFIREHSFTEQEIISLFESKYIPPSATIIGTRNNDISEPSGYWINITISGTDENQNKVSIEYILNIQ